MNIRHILLMVFAWCGMSSMQAKPIVEIRLNQVGYYPDEEKVVVFEGIKAKEKITVTDPLPRSMWRRPGSNAWTGSSLPLARCLCKITLCPRFQQA